MEITNQLPTTDTVDGTPPEARSDLTSAEGPRVLVSLELVIYVALIALTLTLRLVELGTVPLNDREAYEALAAYRTIQPRAAGPRLIAHDPLMFTADVLTMSLVGADTSSARLPTALLGVLLVASPLLFRRWFGRAHALLIAGLLALSPVLLADTWRHAGPRWPLPPAPSC
jgi:predicted membrane-bound mannosyltransferase